MGMAGGSGSKFMHRNKCSRLPKCSLCLSIKFNDLQKLGAGGGDKGGGH